MTQMPLRFCRVCGLEAYTEEDLGLFVKSENCKYGRDNYCRKCRSEYGRKYREANLEHLRQIEIKWREEHPKYDREWRENNVFNVRFQKVRKRSKRRGLTFDLDAQYLEKLWDECEGICLKTGVQMLKTGRMGDPLIMNVDRIEPEKGYIKGNVRLVSQWYNRTRSNYSEDFTLEMCQRVIDHKHAR